MYTCAARASNVEVRLDLLESLAHGHRHAARVGAGEQARSELYFAGNAVFNVGALSADDAPSEASRTGAIGSFTLALLRLGIEQSSPVTTIWSSCSAW
jgi:hypothetical protein